MYYANLKNQGDGNMSDHNTPKKRKPRSPNYPIIDLETAISKVRTIKDREGGAHPSSLRVVLKHWGYGIKSGRGLQLLAALRQYGLVDIKGVGENREVSLTTLAQRILYFDKDSQKYQTEIQKAALNPIIYMEMWGKFKGAGSDASLEEFLIFGRDTPFNEKAALDLIQHYKATIEFANLGGSAILTEHDEDKKNDIEEQEPMETMLGTHEKNNPPIHHNPNGEPKTKIDFPVKISDKMMVNLQIEHPLEDEDLRDFLSAIEALKPGILMSVLNKAENEKDNQ